MAQMRAEISGAVGRAPVPSGLPHQVPDEDRERLEAMTRSIVTRILKEPIGRLKANHDPDYARLVSDMFELEREKSN